MKHKELEQALRLITKVLTDPRVEIGQGDRLRKAKRELVRVARSGKVDEHKIFRAVQVIAAVLLEIVESDVAPRSK
jgi:hypothetical protein